MWRQKFYILLSVLLFIPLGGMSETLPLPIQLRSYFIYPVEGTSKEVDGQIHDFIYDTLEQKKINFYQSLRLERELSASKDFSKKAIQEVFSNTSIDNIIVAKLMSGKNGLTNSSVTVYGKKMEVLYRKVSQNNRSLFSNIKMIQTWVEDFFSNLPPIGTILSLNKSNKHTIDIHFDSRVSLESYKGREFTVMCINRCKGENDKLPRNGVFYEIDKKQIKGFLYQNAFSPQKKFDPEKWVVIPSTKKPTQMEKNIEISTKSIEFSPNYSHSLRGCFTLPFIGNVAGIKKIREEFLRQVINDGRCINKVEPQLMEILKKYDTNLAKYLNTPKVIQLIANKSSSGSIFRVNINSYKLGVVVSLQVLGQNGRDIYFGRREILDSFDPGMVNNLLYQWVLKYVRTLPLDASIVESVEQNILFDLGRQAVHRNDQNLEVIRPEKLTMSKHGDRYDSNWDGRVIAQGVVREIHDQNSLGYILTTVDSSTAIKEGDWVKLIGFDKMANTKPIFMKHNIKNKRNRFRLNAGFDMSKLGGSSDQSKTIASLYLGADIFFPYGLLGFLESERDLSNISDFSLSRNNFKAALGYSTIIDGNLLVSLFDIHIGYMNSFLESSTLQINGLGNLSYEGPYASIRMEAPIYKDSAIYFGVYGSPFLKITNDHDPVLFSTTKKSKMFGSYFNVDYKIRYDMSIFGEILYEKYFTQMDEVLGQPNDVVDITATKTKFRVGIHWDF